MDAQFEQQFTPLINQQAAASKTALDFATPLLKQGTDVLQGPLNYWRTLAGGDRNAISQLLGPELDAITERSRSTRNAVSQFTPRGTPMSNRLGELSQAETGDINRMFLSARPEANQQLAELAQLLFGTGISGFNAATGASGNALQGLLGFRSGNQQERQNRMAGNSNVFRLANFLWSGSG